MTDGGEDLIYLHIPSCGEMGAGVGISNTYYKPSNKLKPYLICIHTT